MPPLCQGLSAKTNSQQTLTKSHQNQALINFFSSPRLSPRVQAFHLLLASPTSRRLHLLKTFWSTFSADIKFSRQGPEPPTFGATCELTPAHSGTLMVKMVVMMTRGKGKGCQDKDGYASLLKMVDIIKVKYWQCIQFHIYVPGPMPVAHLRQS